MSGAKRCGPHGCPCGKRRGLLLLEALLLAGITALAAGLLLPSMADWTEERRLDLAAAEASALIRTVQADAKNGDAQYPGTSLEYKELRLQQKDGRVYYSCRRGIQTTPPAGWLGEGISISPSSVSLRFMKDSFAGASADYSFQLYAPSGTTARKVVVSMYTGRVRVETVPR